MKVTIQQTEKLLKGSNQKFSVLAFSMLLTRLKGCYEKDPSQVLLEESTAEINHFIEKYHTLMVTDIAVIEKL